MIYGSGQINYEVVVAKEGHLFCSNSRNISFDLPTSSNKTLTLNEFKFQNNSILEFEQNLINLSSIENQSTGKIPYSQGFFSFNLFSSQHNSNLVSAQNGYIYASFGTSNETLVPLHQKAKKKAETCEITTWPSN